MYICNKQYYLLYIYVYVHEAFMYFFFHFYSMDAFRYSNCKCLSLKKN